MEIRSEMKESTKAGLRGKYGLTEVHNPLLTLPLDLYQ